MSSTPTCVFSCLCWLGLGAVLNCGAEEAKQAEFRVRPEFKVSAAPPRNHQKIMVDAPGNPPPERSSLAPGFSTIFGAEFTAPAKKVRSRTPGPDGRVYFFCGDGGASIARAEGGVVHVPEEGAILRCEPNGSHLEVFCRGLRDIQDLGLAFDNAGNLFTGDAGSASGDGGRWLYLIEHGDYGWRTGWLQAGLGVARCPWIVEKLWAARFEGQAAWILPPVANVTAGPWTVAHYPGLGFAERYDDHFFTGDPTSRAIFSWVTKSNGAGFLLMDQQEVVGNVPVRALTSRPEGGFHFWTEGLRAFDLTPAVETPDPPVEEAARLLGGEMEHKASIELEALLKSPDQRVRLEAEWRLSVSPDGEPLLREVALAPNGGPMPSIARVHAIWGLGIMARRADMKNLGDGAKMLEPLVPLLEDDDLEVRAQAARVLGDLHVEAAFDGLIKALRNPDERVGLFAAEALGELGRPEALSQLILMMRESGDHDPNLRHAYVDALVGLHDDAAIQQAARHDSPAVRMVALLAMRQLHRPEIAQFLHDDEPSLVREAATGIHDENISEAMGQLAALIKKPTADEALMCRVLNANFRLGQAANAGALATFAAREDEPEVLRIDALKLLTAWRHPAPTDYVTGAPQALPARDIAPVSKAVGPMIPTLTKDAKSPEFKEALAGLVGATSAK